MKIAAISIAVSIAVCMAFNAYCVEGDTTTGEGRYQLVDMKVGNEMVPFLLDSKTGKVWIYQSDIGSKKKFVGLSVEGAAFSRDEKEQEALNKQIEQWHFDGYIDKNLKGLKESIFGAFSYSPEIEKIEGLYGRRKAK